jgi:hypothetical protein
VSKTDYRRNVPENEDAVQQTTAEESGPSP